VRPAPVGGRFCYAPRSPFRRACYWRAEASARAKFTSWRVCLSTPGPRRARHVESPGTVLSVSPQDGQLRRVLLVAKARTVTLTVPDPRRNSVRLSAAKKATMEITLADGSVLSGWGDPRAAAAPLATARLSQRRGSTVLRRRDRRWRAPREPRARPVRAPGGLRHAGTARPICRSDARRARPTSCICCRTNRSRW